MAWAVVRRRVFMEAGLCYWVLRASCSVTPDLSKSAPVGIELQCFLLIRHEIGAAVARHHDGATGVSHARGPIEVPAFHQAINETGGERVARAKHIVNFNRKSRNVAQIFSLFKQSRALVAA